jgi:hypothetical protein
MYMVVKKLGSLSENGSWMMMEWRIDEQWVL